MVVHFVFWPLGEGVPHLLTEGSKPVKQEAVKGGQMVYLPLHSIDSSFKYSI